MIIDNKKVYISGRETKPIYGWQGHVIGRVYKDIYQYSGGVFNILGGIPFTEEEMDFIPDLRVVELTIADKITHYLTPKEILELGKWKNTGRWGRRFIVPLDQWHKYKEVHEDGSISGSGR